MTISEVGICSLPSNIYSLISVRCGALPGKNTTTTTRNDGIGITLKVKKQPGMSQKRSRITGGLLKKNRLNNPHRELSALCHILNLYSHVVCSPATWTTGPTNFVQ